MKYFKLKLAVLASMLFALASVSHAQFDDLYYNPETDYVAVQTSSRDYNEPQQQRYNEPAPAGYNDYDDQYANRMDDYDFHYSSRIRRFNRPMSGGFGFYDPYYVDRFHYDPFYQPGVSIYANTGWNAFSPWRQRPWGYNRRGFGWGASYGSPWCPTPRMGFGNPYAFNRMGMGFVSPMGYGMSPWGMNPYGGWGNTMIINNYYGNNRGFAGSDPWAMDNNYSRFTRLENPQQVARSVSYGPRTIGAARTSSSGLGSRGTGRSQDGVTSGRTNYDQYPASRRRATDGTSRTGRSQQVTGERTSDPSRSINGRTNNANPSSREATGRSSEATPSNRQQNVRSQQQSTRRSLFNNSSRNNNTRSTSPRSNSPSRSSGVNPYSRGTRSSGVNRSSRSSRSSGINRSSRSSSRSSGINRSSRSSSRSSGVRSSGSSSRSSSGRSSRGGGRRG